MSFEYNLDNINQRLTILLLVLQYDAQIQNYFTVWDRILINQERGSLMDFKNYLFSELDQTKVRMIKVPDIIEESIQEIINEIEVIDWQPVIKEYEY